MRDRDFVPLVLIGLSRLATYILKKLEDREEEHFIAMLIIVAVTGSLAQSINLPGIVGAFLAGLAINVAAHAKPAKEKLEFIGNSFFIPIFCIVTGFLIDGPVLLSSIVDNSTLVVGIIAALMIGKGLAAELAGRGPSAICELHARPCGRSPCRKSRRRWPRRLSPLTHLTPQVTA